MAVKFGGVAESAVQYRADVDYDYDYDHEHRFAEHEHESPTEETPEHIMAWILRG